MQGRLRSSSSTTACPRHCSTCWAISHTSVAASGSRSARTPAHPRAAHGSRRPARRWCRGTARRRGERGRPRQLGRRAPDAGRPAPRARLVTARHGLGAGVGEAPLAGRGRSPSTGATAHRWPRSRAATTIRPTHRTDRSCSLRCRARRRLPAHSPGSAVRRRSPVHLARATGRQERGGPTRSRRQHPVVGCAHAGEHVPWGGTLAPPATAAERGRRRPAVAAYEADAIPLGVADDPAGATHPVVWWQPGRTGSIVFVGSPRAGLDRVVSTMIRGISERVSPNDLGLVAVDSSVRRLATAAAMPRTPHRRSRPTGPTRSRPPSNTWPPSWISVVATPMSDVPNSCSSCTTSATSCAASPPAPTGPRPVARRGRPIDRPRDQHHRRHLDDRGVVRPPRRRS